MTTTNNDDVTLIEGVEIKNSERTPCEIWTRVMGYFRPYSQYNKGKKSEFEERKWFSESLCGCRTQKVA